MIDDFYFPEIFPASGYFPDFFRIFRISLNSSDFSNIDNSSYQNKWFTSQILFQDFYFPEIHSISGFFRIFPDFFVYPCNLIFFGNFEYISYKNVLFTFQIFSFCPNFSEFIACESTPSLFSECYQISSE